MKFLLIGLLSLFAVSSFAQSQNPKEQSSKQWEESELLECWEASMSAFMNAGLTREQSIQLTLVECPVEKPLEFTEENYPISYRLNQILLESSKDSIN